VTQRILLVKSGGEAAMPEWQRHFAALAPGLEVRWWDDATVDPAAVRYVLVWDPEPGRLALLPKLEVIFGSGAGVDFITADPLLPRHVPLVRMATPGAAQRMGEFVTWAALSLLKDARRIGIGQAARRWDFFEPDFTAPETTIGIMGLGHMGQAAARMLQGIGFPVIGWSRTPKDVPGVRSFVGEAERAAFLAASRILVCLLPATPETRHILAAPLLAQLPDGAGLVNVGRGSQQKVPDIIAALDSGKLSGAVLDVFETEPLPADDPAWVHPRLLVTPHLASLPPRRERVEHVAKLIAAHERGEALPNTYDHDRGY
jgi:glyoxylate/hydroxypyruvate reductase A